MYVYNIYRKDWTGKDTWEPASSFDHEFLEEYKEQYAKRAAERLEKRRKAEEEVAKQYRRQSGPTEADRVTALAKQYETTGVTYWKAHQQAMVDVMRIDAAKRSGK